VVDPSAIGKYGDFYGIDRWPGPDFARIVGPDSKPQLASIASDERFRFIDRAVAFRGDHGGHSMSSVVRILPSKRSVFEVVGMVPLWLYRPSYPNRCEPPIGEFSVVANFNSSNPAIPHICLPFADWRRYHPYRALDKNLARLLIS